MLCLYFIVELGEMKSKLVYLGFKTERNVMEVKPEGISKRSGDYFHIINKLITTALAGMSPTNMKRRGRLIQYVTGILFCR